MNLPKNYISYNQIRLYQLCPQKYYLTYIKQIRTPINDKVFLGIVFHSVVEKYFLQKIKGIQQNSEHILLYFEDQYKKLKDELDIQWKIPEEDTKKRGLSFVKYFFKELASTIEPLMVEKEMEIEIPEVGVKMRGVIDLVEKDFSITDFKTTTAKWSKARAKNSYLQMFIYKYLFEQCFGDVITKLRFRILYSKSISSIRHQVLCIKSSDVDFTKMIDIVKYVTENISKGVFYKNESYACGFCELINDCKNSSKIES
jgi:hypothetical protein